VGFADGGEPAGRFFHRNGREHTRSGSDAEAFGLKLPEITLQSADFQGFFRDKGTFDVRGTVLLDAFRKNS
jgi:hypothetical protein